MTLLQKHLCNALAVLLVVAAVVLSGCIDQQVPVSVAGPRGPPGNWSGNVTITVTPGTVNINHTFTGAPGTDASVTNVGTTFNALLDFVIPAGATGVNGTPGDQGPIGPTGPTGPQGVNGTPGMNGANGTAATIDVNYTFTGPSGSPASVVNVGSTSDALLDFTIPGGEMNQTPNMTAGPQGISGINGTNGFNGTSATANVNHTFTLPSGSSATVANIGTTTDALFDFGIPTGLTGAAGANGTPGINGSAATIAVNATFTGNPGTFANVTNVGSSSAASLDFTIPKGEPGNSGGIGGQILYFHHPPSPDIAGYEGLKPIPDGGSEVIEHVTVNSGTGQVLVDPYVTDAGYPALTEYPAGLWIFRCFHNVSSAATGTTTAVYKVYNRTASGTETLLFTATSDPITSIDTKEYTTSYVQNVNYTTSLTDRIVVKVYGQSTSVVSRTFNFIYDGTVHTSFVQTPLEIESNLYVRKDGTTPFTGKQSMGGYNLTNVLNPVADQDAATKQYVDSKGLADESAYYWVNTTRPLNGSSIFRDMNSSLLQMRGGTSAPASGANVVVTGNDYVTPGIFLVGVPNAARTTNLVALQINGLTDSPKIDTNGWNITGIKIITGPTDAVNKSYVDSKGLSDESAYLWINGSRSMTGSLNTTSIRLSDAIADLSTTSNSSRLRISSGALNTWGGASINLFGKDSGIYPGWTLIRTDDGADGYVDTISISGHTKTPSISMNGWNVSNVKTISDASDAVNKSYVDSKGLVDESAYLWANGSRNLTGAYFKRDVDTDRLLFYGGTATAGSGAVIIMNGANYTWFPGYFRLVVPNAAKNANIDALRVSGNTDSPYLDMMEHNITGIKTIVGSTDAVNKSYVDSVATSVNGSYYLRDTSLPLTGNLINRSSDTDLLQVMGGKSGSSSIVLYGKSNPITTGGNEIRLGWNNPSTGIFQSAITVESCGAGCMKILTGSNEITNSFTPVSGSDLVNKSYVDSHALPNESIYLWENGTRPMTGNLNTTGIKMSSVVSDITTLTNSSRMRLSGGDSILFGGGTIVLMGKDVAPPYSGAIMLRVPDGAESFKEVLSIYGNTATPRVDLNGWNLTNVKTINDASDAVNKSYVDATSGSGEYALLVQGLAIDPADNTFNYLGPLPKVPPTAGQQNRLYIPKAGTITAAEMFSYSTTAGTAEGINMTVLVNNAVVGNCYITTTSVSAFQRTYENRSMNCPVSAGDYVEVRVGNPVWATNPLGQVYGGHLYITT